MSDDKLYHGVERLRRPERMAMLEVDKVAALALQGLLAKTVLDVGTGSGIFAEAFAARTLAVTGVDIKEEMLAAARTFVPKGTFRIASSDSLPFRDASFELVFMGVVLHENDDPLQAVREAWRVCALRTAVLEWPDVEQAGFGPPRSDRLKSEDVFKYAEAAGFARWTAIHLDHLVLYIMEKS
jgi:ubiquinone/menaquinone biosynthesis C-methylase UbiE